MSVGANKVLLLLVKISIYIWGDVRYNMYVIKGIQNRYLEIDLSRRTFKHGVPEEELFSEFLGGKGLGLKLMVDRGWVTQDPFAENNPLIFATGPFTASAVQTSSRSLLVTKSPLTNTFLDSHAGGQFGTMIKKAGLDFIIIIGKSASPVFLHITPMGVSFEDASALWGKGSFATVKKLADRFPRAAMSTIGQAGENRVRFACINTNDNRQFGRGGAGAVMGSKNLKAVILEGEEKIDIYDRENFSHLNSQLTREISLHPNRARRDDLGTAMWIRMGQEEGCFLPTRNYQQVQFAGYESLTSETMKKTLNWKSSGCPNCVIRCGKLASWNGSHLDGPEYETTAFLGSGCGIADAKAVAHANFLCDDLGLDTISAGVVASFAMEAFEKGIITHQQCGGLDLSFGNADALHALIEQIAHREGIGELLAEGSRIASQTLGRGSEYFAIQTAGMELSGVNIKGCASMGLMLATADFASHTRFWSASAEMAGSLTFQNTPDFIIRGQDEVNARNSLIICDFVPFGLDRLAPLYESLTGIKMDERQMMHIGERISNLTRLFGIKNGRTRQDDTLPQRFFQEKHQAGIFKDRYMTEDVFDQWLDLYYQKRGWNGSGIPAEEKLHLLNLTRI